MSETPAAWKRRKYLASVGRPATVTGERFLKAQAKLRAYQARGMPPSRMSEQTGINMSTLHYFHTNNGMLARHWEAVMRMRFEPPTGSTLIDATGTRRRLAGLWRDGFPLPFLVERTGIPDRSYLQRIIRGGARPGRGSRPHTVTADTAATVREVYEKFEERKPEEFGITPYASARARAFAIKKDAAPRHCWDPDTIDDPKALPEWTGACGTPAGLRIHWREGVPACPACLATRGESDSRPRLSGGKLKALREKKGWTIRQVAEQLDLTSDAVYAWEIGRSGPRSEELFDRLVTLMHCDYEDICEEQ